MKFTFTNAALLDDSLSSLNRKQSAIKFTKNGARSRDPTQIEEEKKQSLDSSNMEVQLIEPVTDESRALLNKPNDETTTACDSIGECCICLDNLSNIMLPCMHAFCNDCIIVWQAKQNNCPICRSEILNKCNGELAFSTLKDECYCVINSGDSLQDLAEEINMKVYGAT